MRNKNREEYIRKAQDRYGDLYDYTGIEYAGIKSIITIRCNTCNKTFDRVAGNHLRWAGCPTCKPDKRKASKDELKARYVAKAVNVHGDLYDYTDSDYTGYDSRIAIRCKKCNNTFERVASYHLAGAGCPHCKVDPRQISTEEFVRRAKEKHGDAYDYSNTDYQGYDSPVTIRCNRCGEDFQQIAYHHVNGRGCQKCGKQKQRLRKLHSEEEE